MESEPNIALVQITCCRAITRWDVLYISCAQYNYVSNERCLRFSQYLTLTIYGVVEKNSNRGQVNSHHNAQQAHKYKNVLHRIRLPQTLQKISFCIISLKELKKFCGCIHNEILTEKNYTSDTLDGICCCSMSAKSFDLS